MHVGIQLLALEHCWSISTASFLTIPLTVLISHRATATYLPTWRTGCDHNSSTIMRNWWKVSKRGWAHRRQTSLTHACKNLLTDKIRVSITSATTLRISFFVYNNFFSLIVSLTAHRRLISQQPSYKLNNYDYDELFTPNIQILNSLSTSHW
jgi:hypothetical protein